MNDWLTGLSSCGWLLLAPTIMWVGGISAYAAKTKNPSVYGAIGVSVPFAVVFLIGLCCKFLV